MGTDVLQRLAIRARMDEVEAIKCIGFMQETGLISILHKEEVDKPDEAKWFSYRLLWDTTKTEVEEAETSSKSVEEDTEALLNEERIEPEQTKAHVYLLHCGEYYKIGRTNNLDRRMEQLAIQLPHKPQVIHTIQTNVPAYTERFFHEKFNSYRLNGEWFQLDKSAIGFFSSFLDISKDSHGVVGYHYLTRLSGL